MYSVCDAAYWRPESIIWSKNKRPTYLPNLILMGRSTSNKGIFKDGLKATVKNLNIRTPEKKNL